MFSRLLISTALVAGMASAANAATITQSQTLANQSTGLSDRAITGIQQFNAALGTLNSVFIELTGNVTGSVQYESLEGAASTVTLNLIARVALSTTTLGNIVVTLPTVTEVRSLTAFDNVIDFGGDSGGMTGSLTATDTVSSLLTGASMNGFFGNGPVSLTMSESGLSNATGPGNLATIFQTLAGGTVKVTYDYTEAPPPPAPVPLPAGMSLMLLGLGALGVAKSRRKV